MPQQRRRASREMYHVAPRGARESIERHGLDHSRSGRGPIVGGDGEVLPSGNYLYRTYSSAMERAAGRSDLDVWAVDGSGLTLLPDPYEDAEAVLVTDPVPSTRLTLLSSRLATDENSWPRSPDDISVGDRVTWSGEDQALWTGVVKGVEGKTVVVRPTYRDGERVVHPVLHSLTYYLLNRQGRRQQRHAHDVGSGTQIQHCPFCGSGSVYARSDGAAQCDFCESVFTVQLQPTHVGTPGNIDGQPYDPFGAEAAPEEEIVPPDEVLARKRRLRAAWLESQQNASRGTRPGRVRH